MLFKNIALLDDKLELQENMYLGTKADKIAYMGSTKPKEDFGEVYDGKGKVSITCPKCKNQFIKKT